MSVNSFLHCLKILKWHSRHSVYPVIQFTIHIFWITKRNVGKSFWVCYHSFTRPLVPVVSNYSVPYTILSIEDTWRKLKIPALVGSVFYSYVGSFLCHFNHVSLLKFLCVCVLSLSSHHHGQAQTHFSHECFLAGSIVRGNGLLWARLLAGRLKKTLPRKSREHPALAPYKVILNLNSITCVNY